MIINRKFITLLALFTATVFSVNAGNTPSFIGLNLSPSKSFSKLGPGPGGAANILRHTSPLGALNVKIMPALYWSSLGLEIEYPISDAFTVGFNILGKLGRTDGKNVVFKIRPESTQDPAYRLEVAAKYYLSNNAPTGIYIQLNASYGNLLFFDGTNRPYTLHSKWKNFDGGVRSPTEIEVPQDYSFGIGAGYQLIVIPKKIIANIMVGTQLYLERTSDIYPAIYLAPSLGYMF